MQKTRKNDYNKENSMKYDGPHTKKARLSGRTELARGQSENTFEPDDKRAHTHSHQPESNFLGVPVHNISVQIDHDPACDPEAPRRKSAIECDRQMKRLQNQSSSHESVKTNGVPTTQSSKGHLKCVHAPDLLHLDVPSRPLFSQRLQIREFCVRFSKLLQLSSRHLGRVANPLSPMEHHSQRHLLVALLKVIDYAEKPPIDPEETKQTISDLSRATEDSDTLWPILISYLEKQKEVPIPPTISYATELDRLHLVNIVIDLALIGDCIREELESAAEEIRVATYQTVKDKAARKQDYEKIKQFMWKQKPHVTDKVESSNWQTQWNSAADKYKSRVGQHDFDLWKILREKSLRRAPIGTDTSGNKYWLFGQRLRDDSPDDLGSRLTVEMPSKRRYLDCGPDEHNSSPPCMPLTDQDESIDVGSAWGQVMTAESTKHLAKWITYRATMTLGPKPKPIDSRAREEQKSLAVSSGEPGHSSASSAGERPSTSGKESPLFSVHIVSSASTNTEPDMAQEHAGNGSQPNSDQSLLDSWVQIEMLVKRIDEYAKYLGP